MGFVNIPDRLLSGVEKPARYTGAELNMTDKTDGEFRFALCFPDVYEIGMSHLGSRILYHILNSREDTICERVYAPWTDMEQAMRQHGVPLFTLETKRPVVECDALGFSLLYEMCYSNILTMLDLAGIPFDPKRRGEDIPIVLCGGPCACNPEPIAPFMDAVMIGDGEQMIQDVVETLLACKRQGLCREDRLRRLSQIEGVYVPSLYEAEYDADGMYAGLRKLDPSAPDTVARRVVRDLDAAPYLGRPIVPYISIVHDRVALEVFRGCTRGCRFCQAGFIYRPVRERKLGTLLEQARELVACTGYDEVSLFSLSTGDYSGIHELVPAVMDEFADKRVSVSLPSLRIDAYLKDDLARKVSRRFYEIPKEKRGKGLRLSVSASSFVPKPFTPFQWESQDTKEELIRKQRLLRDALRGVRGVEFSYHAPDVSVLEAVFARGDRRLAAVLESAWKRGARFDSWDERFDKSAWDGAFAQTGVDPAFYANRPREADEKLPWEHIDMLVTADYLKKEREAAYRASKTGDCRQACKGCFGKKYADYCKVL